MTGSESTVASTKDTQIAFIGLGNMGGPMAKNLLKQGFEVTVYDLSPSAITELKEAGANIAESPKMAATHAQVVITMLPAGQQVKEIYLTQNLLASLAANTLIIDCSTIAAADAKEVAQQAQHYSLDFLDAPVSGGTAGAMAGTLTFIVGGEKVAFERAKPILAAMGKNIFHAGGHGAGQVAKICNNMLLGILMSGTAEALNLGIKNGLDAATLSNIMLQSSGRNWTLEVYNPYPGVMDNAPASRGYSGGFMSAHMHKDLHLALQTAADTGVEVPMGQQATMLYDEHINAFAKLDFSSIMARFIPEVVDE